MSQLAARKVESFGVFFLTAVTPISLAALHTGARAVEPENACTV
jgi:hypothetical protein